MGIVIPEGYAQIKCRWSVNASGEEQISTFGVHPTGTVSAQEIADGVYAVISVVNLLLYQDMVSSLYSVEGVDATLMTATGPIGASHNEHKAGTSGMVPASPQISLLVRKSTTRGGRHGRGRMYLPAAFAAETMIDEVGQLTAFRTGELQAMLEGTLSALGASAYPMVLLHSDETPPDPISKLTMDRIVATQRRRLRR